MNIRRIFATTAFATALIASQATYADRAGAEPAPARSMAVRVDDLNLASTSGADRLTRRIDAAVARVCAVDEAVSLGDKARSRKCRDETRERTLRQVAGLVRAQEQLARDAGR